MQLAANVVIADRFRLSRQLGQGGMGSVWLATHLALDIPCAVKFIEGEIAQLPEAQARFEREAKAAAQLRSPNVVQILDHGVYLGTPYIAMELLDGEDLGKRLQRIGRMGPKDTFRVVGQVCRALTKAHGVGIVHRDLKPDNIFLVPDDDREIAKVLDFGIAKATGSGIDGSNTKTGAMLGTPYYMSPEQAQGIKAVDHRSDLWSLAVIVFQCLTGKLPFESEALGDLLVRIIVAPVPMPSQYAPDLPPTFDRWWERASQRDPNARFQSARELGDALALAFGQSQGLSGEGRAMQGDGTGPYPAGAPGSFGSTPNPALGSTPNPAFGNTPNPAFGMTPNPMFGNTPNPAFGNTPNPAYGNPNQRTPQPYAGTQPLQGVAAPTTGASMSRTYDNAPPQPPKSKGMIFGIAGAVVAVVIGAVGVSFALRGKDTTATTAPSAHASETSAAATPPPPTAPIPTVSTAAIDTARPPSTAVAEPPSAAPTAAAPTPPTAKPPTHAAPVPPAPRPPPAAPPPANNHNKPPKVDLGI